MKISDLKDKKIAVLGYGMEGQAVTRWLLRHNFQPTIFDAKPLEQWENDIKESLNSSGIKIVTGKDYLADLNSFQVIFRSPGIWRLEPQILEAEKNGSIITSQAKWFLENCPAKIIGVTGTKGKGTTCALAFQILDNNPKKEGKIYLTGNIGKEQPFDFMDDLNDNDRVVYELSSFQLQDITQSPQVAVVLMTTSDHLDVHENLQEYHQAKQNVIKFQNENDIAIINVDFEANQVLMDKVKSQIYTISEKPDYNRGATISENDIKLSGFSKPELNFSISTKDIGLKGHHNLQNIAAASLIGAVLNIDSETILESIRSFRGLEHRLQLVDTINGVTYYNDSISTVPETTIAAIDAFTEPLILIAGGSEKYSDYTKLGEKITTSKNIKGVILIGKTGQTIKDSILKSGNFSGQIVDNCNNMTEAVKSAQGIASSGDVIVLSPGAASFDWFKNYKDRGEQFVHAVKNQT